VVRTVTEKRNISQPAGWQAPEHFQMYWNWRCQIDFSNFETENTPFRIHLCRLRDLKIAGKIVYLYSGQKDISYRGGMSDEKNGYFTSSLFANPDGRGSFGCGSTRWSKGRGCIPFDTGLGSIYER
jgi:hypothetical protein